MGDTKPYRSWKATIASLGFESEDAIKKWYKKLLTKVTSRRYMPDKDQTESTLLLAVVYGLAKVIETIDSGEANGRQRFSNLFDSTVDIFKKKTGMPILSSGSGKLTRTMKMDFSMRRIFQHKRSML
ncbi:MAG: hypothetical protein M1836_005567 [Candelina mexicana]|nr:MAG: hypothetical protein M1836_005567 [Candelina mexicana]